MAVEHLTEWAIIRAVKSQTSANAVQIFRQKIIAQFGSPQVMVTDNGPDFVSFSWRHALTEAGAKPKTIAPCNSQSNGRAERMVHTLKIGARRILAAANGKWDIKFSDIEHSHCARRMNNGILLHFLMFGTKRRLPRVETMPELDEKGDQRGENGTSKARYVTVLAIESQ